MRVFNLRKKNAFKSIKKGVSIFTALKDRNDHLKEVISTWIMNSNVNEIVVVDWSSTTSLVSELSNIKSKKVKIIRIEGQTRWLQTKAFNVGARFTSFNKLLKLDSDIILKNNFFEKNILRRGIFYTGNWQIARNENETHLNGQVYVFRKDFFKVNGYNEFLFWYGYDDTDFYKRLQLSGIKRFNLDIETLEHVPHENRTRLKSNEMNYLSLINDSERASLSILRNRFLVENMECWSKRYKMLDYDIIEQNDNVIICKIVDKSVPHIHKSLLIESELVSIKDRLVQLNQKFDNSIIHSKPNDELIKIYLDVCKSMKLS